MRFFFTAGGVVGAEQKGGLLRDYSSLLSFLAHQSFSTCSYVSRQAFRRRPPEVTLRTAIDASWRNFSNVFVLLVLPMKTRFYIFWSKIVVPVATTFSLRGTICATPNFRSAFSAHISTLDSQGNRAAPAGLCHILATFPR